MNKAIATELIWVVLGQALTIAASLAMVRVLTLGLTPLYYGELALALTAVSFVNQVLHGGIINATGRFYSIASERDDLDGYVGAVGRLLLIANTSILVGALVLLPFVGAIVGQQWVFVIGAALAMSLINSLFSSVNAVHLAARQRSKVALHIGGEAWLKVGCVLFLSNTVELTPLYVLGAYSTATLLALISYTIFGLRSIRGLIKFRSRSIWIRELWAYAMPFCLWGGFTWLQMASDRWALQFTSTTEEVGLYAILLQLGYAPIVIIVSLMNTFVGPILFQIIGDGADGTKRAILNRISVVLLLVALSATAMAFLLGTLAHATIFRILVAEEYWSVSPLLPWMMLAGGLFASGQVIELRLMSERRSSPMIKVKIGTAIVGIFANVTGAVVAGPTGVVWAFVIFSSSYLISMLALGFHEVLGGGGYRNGQTTFKDE